MSATKGQVLGMIEEVKEELRVQDRLIGVYDDISVSLRKVWRLVEDLEGAVGGLKLFDPDYKSDGGEEYDPGADL